MEMSVLDINRMDLLMIFMLGFIITLAISPISIKLATKVGAIDIPKDERRIHNRPVPRIGGIGIFCGVSIAYITAIKDRKSVV